MENRFDLAKLSESTVEQIKAFEKELSSEAGEELILIAYQNEEEKNTKKPQ